MGIKKKTICVCVVCVCVSVHTPVYSLTHSVTKTPTFCNSKDYSLAASCIHTSKMYFFQPFQ